MPIYEYNCTECNNDFEFFHRGIDTENDNVQCTACESSDVSKKLSVFAVSTASTEQPACSGGMGPCSMAGCMNN